MTRSDISFPERMSRRPRRTAVVVACGALAVAAIGAALGGTVPGVPLRDGPLDGGAAQLIVLRLRESEKAGVLWGTLRPQNPSDPAITRDSVTLSHNPDGVQQQTEPYLWDARRIELLKTGSIEVYPLPLPSDWTLPRRHPVKGYVLKPAASADSDPYSEMLFEFAVPARASVVGDITIRYHVGWLAYRKTFPTKLRMCPPTDLEPCQN